jgi:hypothetical protein
VGGDLPDLVGVVVVGEAAGGDDELVEVGAEAALEVGVAAGVAEQGDQGAGAQGLAGAGAGGRAGLLAQREQQAHAAGGARAVLAGSGGRGGAERVDLRGLARAREQVDDGGGGPGPLGRRRGGPAAALVGGVDERELGEDLSARGLAEVVDLRVVAAEAAERGRGELVGGQARDQAAGVVQAAHDQHGGVQPQARRAGELGGLGADQAGDVEGHGLLALVVLGGAGAVVGGDEGGAQPGFGAGGLGGEGVGDAVAGGGVAVDVAVDEVHGDAELEAAADGLDERVGGLDGEVDGAAVGGGVVDHAEQREPADGLEDRVGQALGVLDGDRGGGQFFDGAADHPRELEAAVEDREHDDAGQHEPQLGELVPAEAQRVGPGRAVGRGCLFGHMPWSGSAWARRAVESKCQVDSGASPGRNSRASSPRICWVA